MNFSEILDTLKRGSAFELYRLRAAIDRLLADPRWISTIAGRLRRGQRIEFFDPRDNRLRPGVILEMRRTQLLVLESEAAQRWLIDYAAVNLDGIDVDIRERPAQGLGRQEVAVGEIVGFQDREGRQHCGEVVRLNDKTVTVFSEGQRWRVAYALLHRLIEADRERT